MGLNFCEMFMQLCLLRLFKNSFGWEFTNNGFGTFPTLFCVGYFFFFVLFVAVFFFPYLFEFLNKKYCRLLWQMYLNSTIANV